MCATTILKRSHVSEREKGKIHGEFGERNDKILISKMKVKIRLKNHVPLWNTPR